MENKRTRMTRDERQRQIIEVAMDLFIERGYKGTTTVDIAEAAGISEVTLFRNFSSKRDIFLQGVIPVLTQTLEENLFSVECESPRATLERFLVDRLTVISKNHGVVRLVLIENQMNHELADIDFIETIGATIRKGLLEMGFNNMEDDFMIRLVMGSILSFLYLPESDPQKVERFSAQLAATIERLNGKEGE